MEGCQQDYLDYETGEITHAVICLRSERRDEVEDREPKIEKRKKKKFQVPQSYIKDPEARKKRNGSRICQKKLHVDRIEERVIHGTQNVSPIVFMLPTLLLFPAWTSIFCVICEACIHMLSHKRNKMRKYETQYKSPLHLISSEFCGYCRSHRWKEKIKQIQDKRSMRRGLTRAKVAV
ncbi:UNVERIFIED_CONTAM: hypothetical protein PYX00_001414 [Menopon gallinae]|uniref:Recombination activating protein 1 n=1 Tax=Menopon gallinae TaxID=328185 RepID=A0AAW2ICK9_9NEOP